MDSARPGERVTLTADGAELVIAPAIGGAVAAWRWRGHDLLRDTPPSAFAEANVRLMASFPMVPYSNRIRDGRLTFDGATWPLASNLGGHPHTIHGVGWQRAWEVGALIDRGHPATDDELEVLELSGFDREALDFASGALAICLLEYEHYPIGDDRSAWPFAFAAQQCITLAPAFLMVRMTVENRGETPMPAGFGWHPFFPKGDAEIDIEVAGVWQGDAARIPVAFEAPAPWRMSGWASALELDLDHCFRRTANGRLGIRWPDAGVGIDIGADAVFGHVVVYCPPDRDFLAIEPVTNMNDGFNEMARGNPDTGTLRLEPGGSASGSIVLRPYTFDAAGVTRR
jgi:aldose 1-epimerase